MQLDPQKVQEMLSILQSPDGQQLVAALHQKGGNTLQNAIHSATTGDYRDAQNLLSSLLDEPDTKALLKELGNRYG